MLTTLFACSSRTPQSAPEADYKTGNITSQPGTQLSRWEKTVQDAQKEGVVVVYGAPIAEVRTAFTEVFQKRYPGIRLEYTGIGGAQSSPKITSERRAGLYVVDIHIGGTTTMLTTLKEFLAPVKSFLILPEVTDTKNWLEGRLDFADDAEQLNLVFTIDPSPRLVYNTDMVKLSDITSWFDLTKPMFKEKITMWDPRTAGSGLATATFWYIHPLLGADYLKAFAANKPTLTRDQRSQVELVARGKYLLSVDPDPPQVYELNKLGLPIKFPPVLKEGTYSSAGFGSLAVLDRAPHPNATAVFLNWLLGKEGQTTWTTASGFASRRLDVPTEHLPEAAIPKPGISYSPNYKESIVMRKDEIGPRIQEIFTGF